MEITGGEVFLVSLPARRDHAWASKMQQPIGRHAIVRLDTNEGLAGWGEAPAIANWGGSAMRYYGETPQTVRHIVGDYLLPAIRGFEPADIGPLHTRMDAVVKGHPYAKAAIDIACHDLAGRALGVPVHQLLGGKRRGGVKLAHSLGIMDVDRCIDEAEQVAAEGVRAIKCKTGLDRDRDINVVAQLRERLGDAVDLRVDANEGYQTVAEAVEVTRRQEEHRLLLCEQPVAGARALAAVAERVDTPVMADESAWTLQDILELHELGSVACFSCYVTKPGGLWPARQQAEVAAALGFVCDIGGSIEMGIGNAANLHLAAALEAVTLPSVCPVTKPAGAPGPELAGVYYLDDVVTEPFELRDGRVLIPEGPGLGIEVDVEKIERYSA
ncbi:MAG: mandelate racemase/muconate lactonizing enzyme family protein [Microbacterium sp.]